MIDEILLEFHKCNKDSLKTNLKVSSLKPKAAAKFLMKLESRSPSILGSVHSCKNVFHAESPIRMDAFGNRI